MIFSIKKYSDTQHKIQESIIIFTVEKKHNNIHHKKKRKYNDIQKRKNNDIQKKKNNDIQQTGEKSAQACLLTSSKKAAAIVWQRNIYICTYLYLYQFVFVHICICTNLYLYIFLFVPVCICTNLYFFDIFAVVLIFQTPPTKMSYTTHNCHLKI